MEFYVVTTNAPGPGAEALVFEALEGVGVDLMEVTKEQIRASLKAGACEFVELEDEHGQSHGATTSGASWGQRPDGLWVLGPFGRAPEPGTPLGRAEKARERAAVAVDSAERALDGFVFSAEEPPHEVAAFAQAAAQLALAITSLTAVDIAIAAMRDEVIV